MMAEQEGRFNELNAKYCASSNDDKVIVDQLIACIYLAFDVDTDVMSICNAQPFPPLTDAEVYHVRVWKM